MNQTLFTTLKQLYTIRKVPIGDYARIDKNGFQYRIHVYQIEGIGRLSLISTKALLGMMKMETLILSPYEKDAPIFSMDKISVSGVQDTFLAEFYDTRLQETDLSALARVGEKYEDVASYTPESRWYDSIRLPESVYKRGKKMAETYEIMAEEYLMAYIQVLNEAPECDPAAKTAKEKAYARGLIENGGPAIDQLKKQLGEAEAAELFEKYLF